uniref:Transmembrane protein 213 n=1 Tax=Chinchilla lanigera TaxID=34839 RepID=A0A8C2UJS6_CHILA
TPGPQVPPRGMGSPRLTSAPRAALLLSLVLTVHCSSFCCYSKKNWQAGMMHPVLVPSPPDTDFCPQAARCCRSGVDEYGWIAAAVGWGLWFLTLILLCVDKLMKLTPEEPKDLRA